MLLLTTACSAPGTYNPGDPTSSEFYRNILFRCLLDSGTCTNGAGGNIAGLVGTIQLRINQTETLEVFAAGRFEFPTRFAEQTPYTVSITRQPAGQYCVAEDSSGVAGTDDETRVTCRTVIYAAGMFTNFNGQARNGIVRLNADGLEDETFAIGNGITGGTGILQTVSATGDGSGDVLIGGEFTAYNGNAAVNIARVNPDGSFDASFVTGGGFDARVRVIAPAGDGSGDIYAAGQFTTYNGQGAVRIIRLNADGTPDSAFNSGTGFSGIVRALAVTSDGRVYVGGDFATYNGVTVNRIAMLHSDGSLDTSFTGNVGAGSVTSIAIAADGSGDVYVGGSFTTVNGFTANRIARLNADGSTDLGFNITGGGANGTVEVIAPANDGSGDVFLGGNFATFNGNAVSRLLRANADASIDASFNAGAGPNLSPQAIRPAIDGSGKLRVGGQFTQYDGVTRARYVSLNADGSADPATNPPAGFGSTVFAFAP